MGPKRKLLLRGLLTALLLLVCAVEILRFSPLPAPDDERARNMRVIEVSAGYWFPFNRDSSIYLSAAIDPTIAFSDRFLYQSRPFYLFLGSLIYYLTPAVPSGFASLSPFRQIADSRYPDYLLLNKSFSSEQITGAYLACTLLNFLALWVTALIFVGVLGVSAPWSIGLPFLIPLFLSPDLAKPFLWSPHTQMLNLLVPTLCAWLLLRVQSGLTRKQQLWLSFGLGLAALLYGSVLLLFLALVAGTVRHSKKWVLAQVGLFVAPTLIWYGILKISTGTVYNAEIVQYRIFVWMFDALKEHTFWHTFVDHLANFLFRVGLRALPWLFVILLFQVIKFALVRFQKLSPLDPSLLPLYVAASGAAGLTALFYFLMGYYPERLVVSVNAPLLLLAAISAADIHRALGGELIRKVCVAVLWMIMAAFGWTALTGYGAFT